MSRPNLLARVVILLLGLFGLLAAYFWVHKPADLGVFVRVGFGLLNVAVVALLFITAGGLGRLTLRLMRVDTGERLTAPERLALETGFGLGLLSLVTLIFGLIGLFQAPIFTVTVIAAFGLNFRAATNHAKDWGALIRGLRFESRWAAFCALMIGGLVGVNLLYAFAPPTAWDSLTYHLVGVQRYFADGAITAHADNFYLGFPEGVEMLFALAQAPFGQQGTAPLVHAGLGLIGMAAVGGLTRRFADSRAGWTAMLLLAAAYNFTGMFGWAYVDLGAFCYGALALICAVTWRETRSNGWLIALGVTVGLALGVKYTAGTVALAAALVVALTEPRKLIVNVGIVAVCAALIYLPWAVKGLTLYGNPFYPLVFNGLEWDSGRAALFSFNERSLINSGQAWQLALVPVSATIFGQDLTDGYGFTAGAFLLTAWLALPLIWFTLDDRAKSLARLGVLWLIPLIGVWTALSAYSVVGQQTRLMLVAFPAFAVTGALAFHGLSAFPRKPIYVDFIVRVLFLFTLALNVIDVAANLSRSRVIGYLTGVISEEDYRYNQLGAYTGAIAALESDVPEGAQVRFMWEPRTFDCPQAITCVGDMLFDHWSRPLHDGQSVDEMLAAYRSAGDDYWLVFHTGYETYLGVSQRLELDQLLPAALETYFTPIWTDGLRYTLYTWR